MKREGVNRFTTPTSVIAVQDGMIRDQGLEPTPTRRWLLAGGTFNVWEIYLCLLFAELESYRSTRAPFPSPLLDKLIDQNRPVLNALKTLRDKLLHPTKDVSYEETITRYMREVTGRYSAHFHFAAGLQVLLDRYLHDLQDFLVEAYASETAHLPDNQLHAYLAHEESHLKQALAQADNSGDKSALARLLSEHHEFARNLQIDPERRDQPINTRQEKQIRDLFEFKKLLAVTPLPTPNYRPGTAVQAPMHDIISSFIPVPSASQAGNFYRGTLLPPHLRRTQVDHVALVFRSALLLSDSLHHADALLEKTFPGKSRSEIRQLGDWTAHAPVPVTPEEIAASAKASSPGMVGLALLADPFRVYRSIVSRQPELSVSELHPLATDEWVQKFSAWRNIVFHVPDTRVADPHDLEVQFLQMSPEDHLKDLVSGLWRFFLRGDGSADIAN